MNRLLLILLASGLCTTASAQVFIKDLPNGDPYPGYYESGKVATTSTASKQRKLTGPLRVSATLPDHWNNGEQRYFPPIFSQGGYGSCGVSSHVGYMMTSEMNAYNNTDASLLENQLTPMFEYPFTYFGPGKDEMALYVGFPTADIYGGRYESSIYGGSEYSRDDWGWVQGYATFYNAMKHRISEAVSFPYSVETEEGRTALKHYLYNHDGDPDYHGNGGVVCMGVGIARSAQAQVPSSDTNDANGFTGKSYMLHWNLDGGDHAMTIVGYDDRIQFDLDDNGVVGETKNTLGQNENGAWIIANTWGNWANAGFVYCPYDMGGGVSKEVTTPAGKTAYKPQWYWVPYVYKYRGGYTPKRTMKVTMQYDHRSEISVQVGVASDTTATKPEKTFQFSYINYTGDGINDNIYAETPLLGRWADGKMHEEPMEFGVDLTDLTENFDNRQPLKYFLVVNSKSDAAGTGKILSASVIDYEFNAEGVETPFAQKDVTIQNKGKQTIIGTVVNGEPLNAPLNAEVKDGALTWMAPQGSAHEATKYYIYLNSEKVAETTSTSYTTTATEGFYTVRAVYTLNGKEYLSAASNEAPAAGAVTTDNAYDKDIITLTNGSFWVPDVVTNSHNAYTVEFWFKPSYLHDWGDFLFYSTWGDKYMVHTSADGSISAGWANNTSTKERINTPAKTLKKNTWAHIAIVIDGKKHSIYVNGVQKASGTTTSSNSGLPAYWSGRLYFGNGGTLNGKMDELRLWDCARTAEQIKANYQVPIVSPKSTPSLVSYFKMSTYTKNGTTYITDLAGGHDAVVEKNVKAATLADGDTTISKNAATTASASIVAPTTIVAGAPAQMKSVASLAAASYKWTATNATPAETDIANPSFVFNQAGDQTVTLTVTDLSGLQATVSKTVNVQELTPSADFELSAADVEARGRISFVSLNKAPGCRYLWSMPGADQTTATTVNASASYKEVGTKTVTLTVTAPDGQVYTSSKTFDVSLIAPVAGVNISPAVVLKGESVQLNDRSSYDPTSGYWSLLSSNTYLALDGLNGVITPEKAGIYDLTYTATNDLGSNTITVPRALIVCNENSKTGLNFYKGGSQKLSLNVPDGITTKWALDFWLNPDELVENGIGLVSKGDNDSLAITTDTNGSLIMKYGETTKSLADYFVAGQWHQYAIVANGSTITCYRDGVVVGTITSAPTTYKQYFKTLTLGGSGHPFKGNIDEFRLWGSAIGQSTIRSYAVKPITTIASAKSSHKLMVYYDFNQTVLTDVSINDISENGATGTLTGFENTVDFFRPSLGVFGLNFASATNESIVGKMLPQSRFSVAKVSDEETDKEQAPATNVLDGSSSTFWHTQWNTTVNFPHSITFSRTQNDTIRTIQFNYASDDNHVTYRSGNITVEESDDSTTWNTIDRNHILFNFASQNMVLLHPATKKFIRVTFNSSLTGSPFLCITEVNFYGTSFDPTGISEIKAEQSTDKTIYDLMGRKLERVAKPGIYIVGGKKMILK